MTCDDCHQPATTAGGTRHSVHDHLFDFSQPAVDCRQCHDEGDERLGRTPSHDWNIRPVKFPDPVPVERACERCHGETIQANPGWLAEKLRGLKKRL